MANSKLIVIKRSELDEEYYKFVFSRSKLSTPFHNLSWLDLINEVRDDLELKFALFDFGGKAKAFFPFFVKRRFPFAFSSLVYGGYGGPIYLPGDKESAERSIRENFSPRLFTSIKIFEGDCLSGVKGLSKKKYTTWVIGVDSNGFDTVLGGMRAKTRNQVRKGLQSGVKYYNIANSVELEQCKSLYRSLTERLSISSPFPLKMFDVLFKSSFREGIDFLIAKLEGKVIGFSVFISSPNHIFYWLNASDRTYSKYNATNGILAKQIIRKSEKNKRGFLLNLGGVPDGNATLIHFKEGWGAARRDYYCYESALMRWIR